MTREKLLISSCFLGELVKYNGEHNLLDAELLKSLSQEFELFSFCPEVSGGLPTPRIPCEKVSDEPLKVVNKNGEEKTAEFESGAKKALKLCLQNNITKALLKANSPSCSNQYIYDGTFSGVKIQGLGVTGELLLKNGIEVYNEKEIEKLFIHLSN